MIARTWGRAQNGAASSEETSSLVQGRGDACVGERARCRSTIMSAEIREEIKDLKHRLAELRRHL